MAGADLKAGVSATPLLFAKRRPVALAIAKQYVGTDTELDIK